MEFIYLFFAVAMLHVQNPTPKDMWTWQGDNISRILVRKIVS